MVLVDGVVRVGGLGVVVGFADATAASVGSVRAEHLAVLALGPASASKRHEIGIAVLRAVQAASRASRASAAVDVAFRVRCRTTAATAAAAAAAAVASRRPAASTATPSAPGGFMASPHTRALGNARPCVSSTRFFARFFDRSPGRKEAAGDSRAGLGGRFFAKANARGGSGGYLAYKKRVSRGTHHAPSPRAPSPRPPSFRFTARCTLLFHSSRRLCISSNCSFDCSWVGERK